MVGVGWWRRFVNQDIYKRGMGDSPALLVRETGTSETVKFRRIVPSGWRVLFGERLVVEI